MVGAAKTCSAPTLRPARFHRAARTTIAHHGRVVAATSSALAKTTADRSRETYRTLARLPEQPLAQLTPQRRTTLRVVSIRLS